MAISSSGSDSPAEHVAHSPANHGQRQLLDGEDGSGGDAEDASENASVAEEMLLRNGETSRYINEILISRVLEEENGLRSALGERCQETQRGDSDTDESTYQFPILGLVSLSADDTPPGRAFLDLHPTKWQAMQLWEVYVKYVDGFNKILHIPTTQIDVFKAIENPLGAGADVNCLVFAIYFSSLTALTESAVLNMLGYSKRKALANFKRGLEHYLAQANFLESPNLTVLQALTLFLRSMRAHNTGRSVWLLNGLVLRAAQSIGLHRDGTTLGLSVFETELRRRLWWSIISADLRAAEDHGIIISSIDPTVNIEPPSNVDDIELHPGMTEPPANRARWTEMSLALIMKAHCETRIKLDRMLPPFQTTMPLESARRDLVEKMKDYCEKQYFQHCNPVIPSQRAAMLAGRALVGKLDIISRLQWLSLSSRNTTRGLQTDEETLLQTCQILDYANQIRSDELLRSYRWVGEMYPAYHMLLFLLWRLCVEPTGPHVERAWRLVNASFAPEFAKAGFESASPGCKWTVLKMLREKARVRREKALQEAEGGGVEPDGQRIGDEEMVADGTQQQNGQTPLAHSTQADGFGFQWSPDDAEIPDWNEFVGDFMMDGFDVRTF